MGLDTKTYWLIDRQSQCNFDFDFDSDFDFGSGTSQFSREDSHGKFVVEKSKRSQPVNI
jgi:hypothetical protein